MKFSCCVFTLAHRIQLLDVEVIVDDALEAWKCQEMIPPVSVIEVNCVKTGPYEVEKWVEILIARLLISSKNDAS